MPPGVSALASLKFCLRRCLYFRVIPAQAGTHRPSSLLVTPVGAMGPGLRRCDACGEHAPSPNKRVQGLRPCPPEAYDLSKISNLF